MKFAPTATVAVALATMLAVAGALRAQQGESLLPVYAIVDDTVQLRSDRRDVSTYEDVEYSSGVKNCARPVQQRVDAWLRAKGKVPTARHARGSRVRFEVDVVTPKAGTLVIDYAWAPSRQRASLDLRFLSPGKLTPAEREKLVFGLDLIGLRSTLAESMRCT